MILGKATAEEYLGWYGRYMTKRTLRKYEGKVSLELIDVIEKQITKFEKSNWQGVWWDKLLAIKPGDMVMHSVGEEWEKVESIKHNYHPHRDPKEYCEINGLYWQYDDIIDIKTLNR